MKIVNFEDSEAWQKARELTRLVYALTGNSLFSKDYGLKDQAQRASVSCMANIAEGFDSDSDQQFIQFLGYAKRSASEVQAILYVAKDQRYISDSEFNHAYDLAVSVRKLCSGFMKYLKKPAKGAR